MLCISLSSSALQLTAGGMGKSVSALLRQARGSIIRGSLLTVVTLLVIGAGWTYYGITYNKSQARITAADAELVKTNAEVASLVASLAVTTAQADSIQDDVAGLQNTTSVITDLLQTTMELLSNQTTLVSDIADLVATDAVLQGNVTSLDAKLDALEATDAVLAANVSSLDAAVTSLENKDMVLMANVSSLAAIADDLAATNADLVANYTALENRVSALEWISGEVVKMVRADGTDNTDCTVGNPCDFFSALRELARFRGDVGVIEIDSSAGTIELGDNPVIDVHQHILQYGQVYIRGQRSNELFYSTGGGGVWGPENRWTWKSRSGLTVGQYDRQFAYLEATDRVIVIHSNTATVVNMLKNNVAFADAHTMYTTSAALNFTSDLVFNVPNEQITIQDVDIVNLEGTVYSTGSFEPRVRFRGCRLNAPSASSYDGSFELEGVIVQGVNGGKFTTETTAQVAVFTSLYIIDTDFVLHGVNNGFDTLVTGGEIVFAGGISDINSLWVVNTNDTGIVLTRGASVSFANVLLHDASVLVTERSLLTVYQLVLESVTTPAPYAIVVEMASALLTERLTVTGYPTAVFGSDARILFESWVIISGNTGSAIVLNGGRARSVSGGWTISEPNAHVLEISGGAELYFVGNAATYNLNHDAGYYFVYATAGSFIQNSIGAGPSSSGTADPSTGMLFLCGAGATTWTRQSDFASGTPEFCVFV